MTYKLVCCGNPSDIATWSNIPHYLLKAGSISGLLTSGPSLNPSKLALHRKCWNLKQLCLTGHPGGYQYSSSFIQSLWSQSGISGSSNCKPQKFLSHYPLLPPSPWPDNWTVSFYIDATIKQIFENYNTGHRISELFKHNVLRREKHAYQSAKAVITMSHWAAKSVVDYYGIPTNRVHVVPGGANFDTSHLNSSDLNSPPATPTTTAPLRLGFLGKEWERKGGPFVLSIAETLNSLGIPTVVRVVGPQQSSLPPSPLIEYVGYIDKHTNHSQFIREISSWHFGTLFSLFEAFGISTRECLRLGVPVLAHDIGGISSTFTGSYCGKLFSAHPCIQEVLDYIVPLITDYDSYLRLRASLLLRPLEFEWSTSLEKILSILDS